MEFRGERERAVRLLHALGEAHGAPGAEGDVRRIFRRELGEGLTTDGMGSIICERRGRSERPRIMLTGHMDEVGLVVQSITRNGLLKFVPVGGWWSHTLLAQRVRIKTRSGSEILGVIGAKPPHLLSEGEREKVVKIEDMAIDVGASSDDEVRERFGIALGDPIVPYSPFTPMHNPDLLLSKAFDNRVGGALTIHALQLLQGGDHPGVLFGVGTVQEEVGIRGAQTAAAAVNPDVAVVLEGAPADDLPGIPDDERQGVLGRGVQIRLMDPSAIMNRALARHVITLAEGHGIPHQVSVRKSGGTDAKAIHLHGTGVPTIVLGVPARYIHTHNGMIHLDDYLSALELTVRLIGSLDAQTVAAFTAFAD